MGKGGHKMTARLCAAYCTRTLSAGTADVVGVLGSCTDCNTEN